ncbi:ankyrin repeat domain-containing protein 26-like [Vicugna pacos]|uniref:Ankyrin repeat domain-containing protein 26-like n=1 Tax=Vicugna pacos TaxID=30538 RepID=A0ABM5BKD9_VICPA
MSELERAKLTLIPVLFQTRIGGQQNSVVLQKLKPDTLYTITLSSLCCDVEGGRMTGRGETMVRGLARNVQVYNPPNSGDVGWTLPLAGAAAPRVCAALAGTRPPEPIVVPGNTHTGHLEQLIPDTPYSGDIIALHSDGRGVPALPRAKCMRLKSFSPSSLVTLRKAGQAGGEEGAESCLHLAQDSGAGTDKTGQGRGRKPEQPESREARDTGSGGTVEGQLRVSAVARLRVFRTKHSEPLSFTAKVWQRDLCGSSAAPALRLGGGKRPGGKCELKDFHKAAYLGDTRTVQELLSQKKNVDSRDRKNRTALHLACASGQSSVVALLVQWKCDLNARDEESKTALIKGADPNLEDNCQNTALHYAVLAEETSIAAELLRCNANIEAINKDKFTPFLVAIRENKEEMVKFLIESGANVHAIDKLERSALMLAVFHDSPDTVKLLLQKHVNASSRDLHGMSAERYAFRNGFKQKDAVGMVGNEQLQASSSHLPVSAAKKSLPSSHTGAENIQEKLQLSGKDDKEEMVVELGTSNGSRMDPLKNVEQKTDLVVEVSPSHEDISVIRVSPKHDTDDSRPTSDDDLALAPKSTSEIQLRKHVHHLSGAAGLGEKNTLHGQIESSTEKYPHLKPAVGVKDSVPKKTGAMKNLQRLKSADLDLERTSEEEEERLDGSENNYSLVKEQMNSVDFLDDLTLSPGRASEDSESLFHNFKDTLRPIKRLGPESEDSDRLLKIQDPVDSFRSIELKESDCAVLKGKLKEMEDKVNWLHTELLKTREEKSQLKLQNMEWERELCRMRFTLEQETKKKKNSYTLYRKSKDDLKRKEKQYNEQDYLKQQLESTARAQECKLKSVRNKPNQVLEERNDAQRQLSREQNAQLIQDEILVHSLSQQKEAEKANKKMNAEDTMDFELSDRGQAQHSNKETEPLSQSKQEDVIKYIAKQALLKETICQLQSENTLLRQQLEGARNEARSEKTIFNTPEPFLDHTGKLEAMSRRVLMLEEGNMELIKECRRLKDRLCQYETDRAEMEACMRQLQQELADTRKKVSILEASLEVTAHHQTNSENKRQDGERKPHQAANPNADLPAKEESTSSVLLHLSAETQLLLKELLPMTEMQRKREALEEEKKKLEEEVVTLRRHLETNAVEHSQVEQDKRETEEQARRDEVEALKELRRAMQYKRETEKQGRHDIVEKLKEISQFLQAQAALQENVLRECRRASVSQTEQRVKDLEPELKNDSNENRLEQYKQLYLEELENRKSLASQLTSVNERLAEMSSKLQLEKQHKSSFPRFVPTRPVGEPPSAAGTSAEAKGSPTRRRRFKTVSDPSTNLSDPLFRMRKKLEKNTDRELKKATTELESHCHRRSRSLDGRVKSKSRSGFESA